MRLLLYSILIACIVAGQKAMAEYRAFELKITNTEKNKDYSVVSILDHLQYPKYHPMLKNEVIAYVDSWRCKENMSEFRRPCAKPDRTPALLAPKPSAKPAASPAPKPKIP
jgi:hypothetical protein